MRFNAIKLNHQNSLHVVVSVSNDLVSDQRVRKVCQMLSDDGFEITLLGRQMRKSPSMPMRNYRVKRFKLFFETGFLFYAALNFRLFWYLLFCKADIFHSNDLDTLLPNFLAAKIRRKPLIYDTHEYFTGVPEIQQRPNVKKVWQTLESIIFPKLKYVFTVNDSIAELYFQQYGLKPQVLRNVPDANHFEKTKTRTILGMPEEKFILILQGNGINIHRGAEEAVMALQYLDHAVLYIIGSGDALPELLRLTEYYQLQDKIKFVGRLPYDEMMQFTANADLGLTLDKDNNINYKLSLPNKIFDYLLAGIPIMASNLPEVARVIHETQDGVIIKQVNENEIAKAVNNLMHNKDEFMRLKKHALEHAQSYTWANESKAMQMLYKEIRENASHI